jgi:choline-sulfatase
VLPTICDFAGVKPPEDLDGRSLRPLLGANPRGWRDVLVSELNEGRMLRAGHQKYIVYQRGAVRSEFLFDLQKARVRLPTWRRCPMPAAS